MFLSLFWGASQRKGMAVPCPYFRRDRAREGRGGRNRERDAPTTNLQKWDAPLFSALLLGERRKEG